MQTYTITTATLKADPYALDKIMGLDHVIMVHADGTITDANGIYAPTMTGDTATGNTTLDTPGWALIGGYTGQQGGGFVMHNSEFIGGRMARDIITDPGYYVAVPCEWSGETEDDDVTEGWGLAYMPYPDEWDAPDTGSDVLTDLLSAYLSKGGHAGTVASLSVYEHSNGTAEITFAESPKFYSYTHACMHVIDLINALS